MLTCTFVQEVSQQTAHDSLVADNQHIPLAFQLHDYWFQALHQVLVRLQGERKDIQNLLFLGTFKHND